MRSKCANSISALHPAPLRHRSIAVGWPRSGADSEIGLVIP
jgi:hypothetical protein